MSGTPPQRSRRRTARSLNWSELDIDAISQVGPEDADAAVVSWDRLAPAAARGLLDATEEDDDASRED
jgi:hypothetical protein